MQMCQSVWSWEDEKCEKRSSPECNGLEDEVLRV